MKRDDISASTCCQLDVKSNATKTSDNNINIKIKIRGSLAAQLQRKMIGSLSGYGFYALRMKMRIVIK